MNTANANIGVGVVTLFLALTIWAGLLVAQVPAQPTYSSAQAASQALFEAVQNGNASGIMQILGTGKELVSSGDDVEDKAEREQFAAKYAEMHRFVRRGDGSLALYIGAENWPFPVPLVSRDGRWFFDADAGTREVFFRKIGEDELTAIQTCRALVSGDSQPTDESVLKYARGFLNAQRSAVASESTKAAGNEEPFHGYYFRAWTPGKEKEVSSAKVKPAFVAYPVEYRGSGVMTFVVTYDGVVYEEDLGPNTAKVAQTMTKWRSDSGWHPVE